MTIPLEQLSAMVEQLHARQAIHDCVLRYARGIDRFDRELVLSAYHSDAIDDHGKFLGSREEFWEWAVAQHSRVHLSHQHFIVNHVCELAGTTAHTETYYMFVSMNREGPAMSMTGGRYIDRFEKREGEWRIAYRICTRDWAMLDERPSFDDLSSFTSTRHLLSDELREFMNAGFATRRDAQDVSYARPLRAAPERQEAWDRLGL